MRVLLLGGLAAFAAADVVVSRTINSLPAGDGTLTIEGSACTGHDDYGSNNCDVHWGQSYKIDYDVNLTQDIEAGATFEVDATLDKLVPFKFSCPLCGDNCTITVPIVKETISFALPPCPITKQGLKGSITEALPAKSPVPLKIGFTGNVKAHDKSGNLLADIDAVGTVSPSGLALELEREA
jgi:hypothetical protein